MTIVSPYLRWSICSSGAGTSTVKSTFDTIFRREGVKAAVIEGDALTPGLYEAVMHVDEYFAALGTRLPSPTFLSKVPLRFGIHDPSQRYHLAVLFNPWSYSYYRGS